MPTATADAYQKRFRAVLAYIDAHAEERLGVEELSAVASLSKFHFHRQFTQLFGISVHRYVLLVRLRRAASKLAFRDDRILEIALDCGYESHEAFSRAFKKAVGQTPSGFREGPEWEQWHSTQERLSALRTRHLEAVLPDVRVMTFPETRVAALEHRGDVKRLGDSLRRFIEWRKRERLSPRVSATFNIVYDDPADTDPEDFRFDICAATGRTIADNPFGVADKTIPGGRCATVRHVGSDDALFTTVASLYATWLVSSGEEPRDFPLYLQRVRFFPDVPERDAVTDIFIPLRAKPDDSP